MPKVTVLMCVYNGERYLRESVESILHQTFSDFEMLIVNDCSDDRTDEVLQSYSDSRIRIIRNEKNMGLTKSLNTGLEMSTGEYIARMDADDIAYPSRIEELCSVLDEHPDVALVSSAYEFIDSEGSVLDTIKNVSESVLIKEGLLGVNIVHSAFMFRRECALIIGGYDERYRYAQDYDFTLRMSERWNLFNIDRVLHKYRVHSLSISNSKPEERALIDMRIREEAARRHAEDEKVLSPRPVISNSMTAKYGTSKLCRIFNDFGCHYLKHGFFKLAKREFLISLDISPFNLKTYYCLFWRLPLYKVLSVNE